MQIMKTGEKHNLLLKLTKKNLKFEWLIDITIMLYLFFLELAFAHSKLQM